MLKYCRNKNNLTQKQIARKSGLSQSYISKLEKNEVLHSPTVKQVISLAAALNISPYELCTWFINKELSKL